MKPRSDRQVCVIGLGHFGGSLARALARQCQVLAIDSDIHRVNEIADEVHRALSLDARDAATARTRWIAAFNGYTG